MIHSLHAEHGPWEIEQGSHGRESATRSAVLICDKCGVIETLHNLYTMLDHAYVQRRSVEHNIIKLWERLHEMDNERADQSSA